jgi:hypothetical protein
MGGNMEFKVQVTYSDDRCTYAREILTVRAVSKKHAMDKAIQRIQATVPEWREVEAHVLQVWDLLYGGI